MDGVSREILAAADTVVFLDVPRLTCLVRCLRRNVRYLFRSRPGLPERCPEILILPTLVRLIWRFPQEARPRILAAIEANGDRQRFVHVQSDVELRAFLAEVEATTGRT